MRRFLVVPFAVVAALTNLPGLVTAGTLLAESIRIHIFGVAYFEYPYLLTAGVCLAVSGAGIFAAGTVIAKGGRRGLLALASLTVGLMGAILIPDVEPQARMGVASSNFFFRADRRVYHWGVDHGRYPASEQELRDSLGQQLSGEPAIFLRRGRPIPYGVRFATQTKGSLDSSVPPDPGIVDYSVAPDGKEYFLRMTTLQKPVGETVVFYHLPGDKNAWVVTGKLPVPTTEAKP